MSLSAPTMVIFLISLVVTVVGILVGLAIIPSLPVSAFWIVVIGYAILLAGNLFKGV